MSQSNFSILADPMIFSKKVFSTSLEADILMLAVSKSSEAKRKGLEGKLVSTWLFSITKACSRKFST